MAISVKNLIWGYKKPINTSPFSENLPNKGIIALLGPNGAGKTALLKTLSGLLKPINGYVYLDNLNLHHIKPRQRAKLFAWTNANLPTKIPLTAEQVFDILQKSTPEQKAFWTKKFNINHLLNIQFSKLSDGQKKRLLIAKAFARNTKIILLDEPDNHLDFDQVDLLFNVIRQQAQHRLIIFATHNLSLALQNSHLLWIITNGKIFTTTAEDLLISPTPEIKFLSPQVLLKALCNVHTNLTLPNKDLALTLFKQKFDVNPRLYNNIKPELNRKIYPSFYELIKHLLHSGKV